MKIAIIIYKKVKRLLKIYIVNNFCPVKNAPSMLLGALCIKLKLHELEIELFDFFNTCCSGVAGTASIIKC